MDEIKPIISSQSKFFHYEGYIDTFNLVANEAVTWSLNGGVDESKFNIDNSSGKLSFKSAPDYENPTDVGIDNIYNVVVNSTDLAGNISEDFPIEVEVLDAEKLAQQ